MDMQEGNLGLPFDDADSSVINRLTLMGVCEINGRWCLVNLRL